jgi:hypothetical protein
MIFLRNYFGHPCQCDVTTSVEQFWNEMVSRHCRKITAEWVVLTCVMFRKWGEFLLHSCCVRPLIQVHFFTDIHEVHYDYHGAWDRLLNDDLWRIKKLAAVTYFKVGPAILASGWRDWGKPRRFQSRWPASWFRTERGTPLIFTRNCNHVTKTQQFENQCTAPLQIERVCHACRCWSRGMCAAAPCHVSIISFKTESLELI